MSYYSTILAANPIGYWRLGETTGTTAADSTANALTGTYTNAPTLGVAGALLENDLAAGFSKAASSHVATANNTLLNVGDVFSVECWIKRLNTTAADNAIAGRELNSWDFRLKSTNVLELAQSGGQANIARSSATITDTTTWHHVVLTKNGSSTHFYVDGLEGTTVGTNATLTNPGTTALTIARSRPAGTTYGDLYIDEVAYYAYALSANSVAAHYNAAGCIPHKLVTAPFSGVFSGLRSN